MKNLLLISAFLFFGIDAFGQTHRIDSLKSTISQTSDKAVKLKNTFAICEEYYSLSPDAFYHYAELSSQLATSQNNEPAQKQANYYLANALAQKSSNDTALRLIEKNIKLLAGNSDKENTHLRNLFILLKTRILIRTNRYKDALSILFELLQSVENSKDTVLEVRTLSNIGWVKMEMLQNKEAIKWLRKSINIPQAPYTPQLAIVYSNISSAYSNVPMVDSAFFFIKRSILISTKIEALSNLANAYCIEAYCYKFTKQYSLAERDYNIAISIRKKMGDMFFIVSDMAEFADFYAQTNQPLKGIILTLQAIDSANKYKIAAKQYLLYSVLAENYHVSKDYPNYSKTLEKIIELRDSTYQKNSVDSLTSFQTKYELKKREATIAQQQLALVRENSMLYGSVVIVVLGCIIALLLFREARRKQKLKLQQIHDEEKRLSAQAVASGQEKERKRIAADLHDNLGAQLSFIKRNVNFIIDRPEGFNKTDERKYLNYVNDTAQNAMIDLRETIWVLNRDEVSIQEFADKLKSYLKQQLVDRNLTSWEFHDDIGQNWKLSSGEVMHLFRIMQEVISNIIKHSGADHIYVQLSSHQPDTYELEIADNGKGFDVENEHDGHYGLLNIQGRSIAINARLLIESSPEKGTRILLKKDKNNANELYNNTPPVNNFTL